jgi:hypothetical protein
MKKPDREEIRQGRNQTGGNQAERKLTKKKSERDREEA